MINKQVFTQAKALLSMIVRVSPLITIFRSVETVVTAMAVFVAIISVFATVPVLVVVKTMFVTITVFVVRVTVFMIVITGFVSVPRIVPLRIFRPLSLMTTVGLKKFFFFVTPVRNVLSNLKRILVPFISWGLLAMFFPLLHPSSIHLRVQVISSRPFSWLHSHFPLQSGSITTPRSDF